MRESFGLSLPDFYNRMISEKVIRYRKLCQTYQKYRFAM